MKHAKELQARNDDLVKALKAIGRIVSDPTLKPSQRTERVLSVLFMYDCAPETPVPSEPKP